MKTITLKAFKETYFPKLTQLQFSAMLNLNNSYVSKVMHGKYDCSLKSKKWIELCNYIKNNYNLILISENAYALEGEKVEKIISTLQSKVAEQERQIKEYEEIIRELTRAITITNRAKGALEKGKFVLAKYKFNQRE